MSDFDSIIHYLDKKKGEMLAFLEQLVNTDSGTHFKVGVSQIADIIVPKLRELDFAVEQLSQLDFGDHILAHKEGYSSKKLLCIGHMDTVFAKGEAKKRPFFVDGDKAYGPGVIDMKGGIVVLLSSLYALKEVDPDFYQSLNLALLLNSDEEVTSPSSTPYFIKEAQAADSVCVFEPARPNGQVVIERKGVGKYHLNVYGKAAHAGSQPELGISAIEELSRKILDFHSLTDFESGLTVNVGVIKGGRRFNIIADHAYAEIDVRVVDQTQIDRINREFKRICSPYVDGIRIELKGDIRVPPMLKTKRSLELLSLFQEAGRELGLNIEEISTGGGSDGNRTSYYSPTIDGLGPQGTGAHSPEEVLYVPTLLERSKVFVIFVKKWEQFFAPKENYPKGFPSI